MDDNLISPLETGVTIFFLEEDDDTQRALKGKLRKLGFRVLLTVNMEDAFDWMSTGYIHADLVLVDLLRKSPAEALEVGRKLRTHARYDDHTPLVVMAESFTEELAGSNDNVNNNDWVCYLENAGQLETLLHSLTGKKAA
jgi:DNA-binding NtrC family response regulator